MTWIVGRPFMFGYSAGISDVRVTLADKTERDCLQKIYAVGRFMALGFAGSVNIGFRMVARLTELLQNDDPEIAWDPQAVAEWWPADAKDVFHSAPPRQQKLGAALILLSVHPDENAGAVPWAQSYVHRFCSPDFAAQECPANEVVSIGSGSDVVPYAAALKEVAGNFAHLQMEVGSPGGAAYGLWATVQSSVQRNPVPGISRHLQICMVRRGEITIRNCNRRSFGGSGGDLVMPALARSPDELTHLLGATAEGASC